MSRIARVLCEGLYFGEGRAGVKGGFGLAISSPEPSNPGLPPETFA
jgi:hypothetical protein